jgi:hypothetical protein
MFSPLILMTIFMIEPLFRIALIRYRFGEIAFYISTFLQAAALATSSFFMISMTVDRRVIPDHAVIIRPEGNIDRTAFDYIILLHFLPSV